MFQFISGPLSVAGKIAAIILAYLAPIGVLLTMYVHQMSERTAFTSKEIDGTTYLSAVWPQLIPMMSHLGGDIPRLHPAELAAFEDAAIRFDPVMRTEPASRALRLLEAPSADDRLGQLPSEIGKPSILIKLGQLRIAALEIEAAIDAGERGNPASRIGVSLARHRAAFVAAVAELERAIADDLADDMKPDQMRLASLAQWVFLADASNQLWLVARGCPSGRDACFQIARRSERYTVGSGPSA